MPAHQTHVLLHAGSRWDQDRRLFGRRLRFTNQMCVVKRSMLMRYFLLSRNTWGVVSEGLPCATSLSMSNLVYLVDRVAKPRRMLGELLDTCADVEAIA